MDSSKKSEPINVTHDSSTLLVPVYSGSGQCKHKPVDISIKPECISENRSEIGQDQIPKQDPLVEKIADDSDETDAASDVVNVSRGLRERLHFPPVPLFLEHVRARIKQLPLPRIPQPTSDEMKLTQGASNISSRLIRHRFQRARRLRTLDDLLVWRHRSAAHDRQTADLASARLAELNVQRFDLENRYRQSREQLSALASAAQEARTARAKAIKAKQTALAIMTTNLPSDAKTRSLVKNSTTESLLEQSIQPPDASAQPAVPISSP
ncbi:unnamed protein product [Protopolystoma xenopodis]|uniref:Uncharacterized protein n=1 Tax=Protopolystoma xenopodis TaxID=117903 RepID=A0A3S5CK46_9PLAT|nr:unnamed protein product [Protopolystoma xenopodis]